jgi:tRNA pseudouridine55 synthase
MLKSIYDFAEGEVLLIDKPLEWTSFDAVKKIRNLTKAKKVGHAGTLDPLATGLLILCTGKKTKTIDTYQAQEKEYTGTFWIGKTSKSFDLETEVEDVADITHLTKEDFEKAAAQLTGKIQQIPPMFSAIKQDGERLYELAREGKTVEIKSREIEIKEFEITGVEGDQVHFRIVCSKGTYIRSMARDFGDILKVGATLKALRRTRIGDFHVDNAPTVSDFIDHVKMLNTQV